MNSSLIKKAKYNPKAFGQLYEILYDDVYKYVFFRVKSQEIAEDLTSIIWEKILYNISKLKSNHPISFKVWLFRIVKNTIYEHYRNSHKMKTINIDDIKMPSEEKITEMIKNNELNTYLLQLLQGLPENQREIVTLKFFSEFKNKEIASILNISEQMVASYLSRGLKSLRAKVEFLL